MTINTAFFDEWRPRALAVLRIVTGYLLIPHGTAKLFGAPHQQMFDGLQLISLMGLAGILEVFGGALFLIGLFTRPVAFHPVRLHGGGLLHGARQPGPPPPADAEPGRACRALLLRVSVLRRCWTRRLEC